MEDGPIEYFERGMGRNDKLIRRFKLKPKDFTWDELVALLAHFDYKEIKGGKTSCSPSQIY